MPRPSRVRSLPRPRAARRSTAALLLLVPVAASACGSSRAHGPERSELLSAAAPRSANCVVEAEPEVLPRVDTVVDSALLASAVGELRRQDSAPAGHVLLTLAFDAGGLNIRRDVIEHGTSPLVADSVQRLVFAARRQVPEAEQEWGVRLRIDLGEPPRMRIGRREFCPPVARDRQLDAAMHSLTPAGVRHRGLRRERVVHMRALVNEAGHITSAHIVRGELRGSSLERDLAQHLRQYLFEPATIDRVPAPAWVKIPLRLPG